MRISDDPVTLLDQAKQQLGSVGAILGPSTGSIV
jgi:hypothetical protein